MIILGIHLSSHDSGVAIIKDGRILAAINEERLSRIKMDSTPPYQSIKKVLEITGLTRKDIDLLVFADMPPGLKRDFYFAWQQNQRVWYTKFRYLKSFLNRKAFSRGRLFRQIGLLGLKQAWDSARAIKEIIKNFKEDGFSGQVKFVAHDLAHAASTYYTSGLKDSFVGIVEGSSFINTCSFWRPIRGGLEKVFQVPLPHSPGRYYEIVTLILGFNPKRHGGKITGLAAFGNSDKCYEKVKKLLYIDKDQIRTSPKLYQLHDEYFAKNRQIPDLFKDDSREDIAAAFQRRLEEVVIEQFKILARKYSIKNLSLAGGVFANVKLNMEIRNLPEVEQIFIHPGMGDVGEALGAALGAYAEHDKNFTPFYLEDVYFGPEFTNTEIEKSLKRNGLKYRRVNIPKEVSKLLSTNKVVGFFQGRMEYGPRALGNRSILYPATDKKVNDWLNKQLKRTEFMPFAPVTLMERADECYRGLDKCRHAAKFMTIALPATDYMAENMPAAVHIDKTARPQLVNEGTNKIYYDTIKEYEKITGLPGIINTSFNMHEEPIVCTPDEAIKSYQESNLDALAIGDYLVQKNDG